MGTPGWIEYGGLRLHGGGGGGGGGGAAAAAAAAACARRLGPAGAMAAGPATQPAPLVPASKSLRNRICRGENGASGHSLGWLGPHTMYTSLLTFQTERTTTNDWSISLDQHADASGRLNNPIIAWPQSIQTCALEDGGLWISRMGRGRDCDVMACCCGGAVGESSAGGGRAAAAAIDPEVVGSGSFPAPQRPPSENVRQERSSRFPALIWSSFFRSAPLFSKPSLELQICMCLFLFCFYFACLCVLHLFASISCPIRGRSSPMAGSGLRDRPTVRARA